MKRTKPLPPSDNKGMMPGQTPYTDKEKKLLQNLVSDAAGDDSGENGEEVRFREEAKDTLVSRRRTVRVEMSDGDFITTDIYGTKKDDEKTMRQGVRVDFLG